jgi:hypothetical protein
MEGSVHVLKKQIYQHLHWGTKENNEEISQDSRWPGRDSIWASPEYKFRAWPVDQPVRSLNIQY